MSVRSVEGTVIFLELICQMKNHIAIIFLALFVLFV